MPPFGSIGAGAGVLALLVASLAVLLAGPRLLVGAAKVLAVGGLALGVAGFVQELVAHGFVFEPGRRGGGSLMASAGLVIFTFAATRVADRRRHARDRRRTATARAAARQ